MTLNVFMAQWKKPVKKDWTNQVKKDLADFRMDVNLFEIKKKSIESFKKYVKVKALEYEFSRLMEIKLKHSKMDNMNYTKLELQKYLKLENIDANGAKTIFRYRTRMAQFGENYRQGKTPVNCPLCGLHLDNQMMGFSNCPVIKANIIIRGQYEDVFKQTIPSELVKTLENIDKFREENC